MKEKVCLRCDSKKNIDNFNRDKTRKDGRHPYCRLCQREISAPYFKLHKEDAKANSREWYRNNIERIKVYSSDEEVKKRKRKYMKEYRLLNKDRKRKNAKIYEAKRSKEDVSYRLSNGLRKRLGSAIKGNQKSGSAVRDLGCPIEDFKSYIENKFYDKMSWDNYGNGPDKWQLDHIVALCLFDLTQRDQFLKACHFTNIQPLWYSDHIKKTEKDIKKHKNG